MYKIQWESSRHAGTPVLPGEASVQASRGAAANTGTAAPLPDSVKRRAAILPSAPPHPPPGPLPGSGALLVNAFLFDRRTFISRVEWDSP